MEWNEMEWSIKCTANTSVIWKTSLFSIGAIEHVRRTTKLFLACARFLALSSFSDFDKIESKLIEGHKWHFRQAAAAAAVALKH